MDWKRVFDLKDINWWIMLSGIGMNFAMMSFMFLAITFAESQGMAPELSSFLPPR